MTMPEPWFNVNHCLQQTRGKLGGSHLSASDSARVPFYDDRRATTSRLITVGPPDGPHVKIPTAYTITVTGEAPYDLRLDVTWDPTSAATPSTN